MLLLGSPLYEVSFLYAALEIIATLTTRVQQFFIFIALAIRNPVHFFQKSCLKYTTTLAVTNPMFNFPTNGLSNARRHWLLQTLCSISHKSGAVFCFFSCPLGPNGTAHIWDRILLDLLLTPQQLAWAHTRWRPLHCRARQCASPSCSFCSPGAEVGPFTQDIADRAHEYLARG